MSDTPGQHRLDHVDAMRAVAVILVMWTHYAELYAPIAGTQHILNTIQQSLNFGRIGVVIFFCISGMLIPTSLRGSRGDGTRRFLIRRFFRLYPAFWLSIPLGYAAYWLLFGTRMSASGIVANLSMIPTAFGYDAIMAHYWTLETELYFYALCLLIFLLGRLHSMRDLCIVCVGLCAAFLITSALKIIPAHALGQYKGMLYHLAIMFWGACFRQTYDHPDAMVRLWTRHPSRRSLVISHRMAFSFVTAVVITVALLMAALNLHQHDLAHFPSSLAYIVGIFAFLLLATFLKIHGKFFAWLGGISYSIYLMHGIPLYVIYWYCKTHGLTGAPLGLYIAVTVPPALALSWASYTAMEITGIRIGRALTPSKRTSPGSPATSSAAGRSPLMTRDGS